MVETLPGVHFFNIWYPGKISDAMSLRAVPVEMSV